MKELEIDEDMFEEDKINYLKQECKRNRKNNNNIFNNGIRLCICRIYGVV